LSNFRRPLVTKKLKKKQWAQIVFSVILAGFPVQKIQNKNLNFCVAYCVRITSFDLKAVRVCQYLFHNTNRAPLCEKYNFRSPSCKKEKQNKMREKKFYKHQTLTFKNPGSLVCPFGTYR